MLPSVAAAHAAVRWCLLICVFVAPISSLEASNGAKRRISSEEPDKALLKNCTVSCLGLSEKCFAEGCPNSEECATAAVVWPLGQPMNKDCQETAAEGCRKELFPKGWAQIDTVSCGDVRDKCLKDFDRMMTCITTTPSCQKLKTQESRLVLLDSYRPKVDACHVRKNDSVRECAVKCSGLAHRCFESGCPGLAECATNGIVWPFGKPQDSNCIEAAEVGCRAELNQNECRKMSDTCLLKMTETLKCWGEDWNCLSLKEIREATKQFSDKVTKCPDEKEAARAKCNQDCSGLDSTCFDSSGKCKEGDGCGTAKLVWPLLKPVGNDCFPAEPEGCRQQVYPLTTCIGDQPPEECLQICDKLSSDCRVAVKRSADMLLDCPACQQLFEAKSAANHLLDVLNRCKPGKQTSLIDGRNISEMQSVELDDRAHMVLQEDGSKVRASPIRREPRSE
eukprot:gnl/TRDRNA2_/TRDRNA2_85825_c0_seq1.p1 gnl/TRDRNA2_/TRDRNA2_85825_c0~~gnl/TRDRNA2_/TRDRNA2_85825_c0_seq1.p1  ORF type:complete len:450 (-),score=60.28 gnl/TRDRNA2_/TRDRNA2_85825_c0_seq1:36-1385(-)